MKNLTPFTLIIQRENGTRFRLLAADVTPTVEYKPAIVRGTLNGVEIYARSSKRVNFEGITLKREDAPFIVTKEVFDALPDSAIEFITVDPTKVTYHDLGNKVHKGFISKTDVEVIPFAE